MFLVSDLLNPLLIDALLTVRYNNARLQNYEIRFCKTQTGQVEQVTYTPLCAQPPQDGFWWEMKVS
jgi:hypothetical protein